MNLIYPAAGILVGDRKGFAGQAEIEQAGPTHVAGRKEQLWTDNYSSLFKVLE